MSMMILGIVEPRFDAPLGESGSAPGVHTTDRCYGPLGGGETVRLWLPDSERFIFVFAPELSESGARFAPSAATRLPVARCFVVRWLSELERDDRKSPRSVKLSNHGKYSSASRRFGPLLQGMDPCSLTTSHCRIRRALLFLEEMPHHSRTAGRWCFRLHGSLAPRQKLSAWMCRGLLPARALSPMCP